MQARHFCKNPGPGSAVNNAGRMLSIQREQKQPLFCDGHEENVIKASPRI